MNLKKVFCIFLLFLIRLSYAQEYDPKITFQKLSIEEKSYPAFKTFIDFDFEKVERSWWRFSKKFGHPLNMRGYYQTTIPGNRKKGEEAVILYSKSIKYGRGTMFYLALATEGLNSATERKYLDQVQRLLYEFQLQVYIRFYEHLLEELEKQAAGTSSELEKAMGSTREEERLFEKLMQIRGEIEVVKKKVAELN